MPNRYKVFLIDSDEEITSPLKAFLEKSGYEVMVDTNAETGIEKAVEFSPQLILIEVKLPGLDGVEACIEIRRKQKLNKSIIAFYTNNREDYSQIAAFNAGADDYINKPLNPRVLAQRIKALLRRYFADYKINTENSVGNIRIDREKYLIFKQGEEISLPRKEFELMALLATNPKKVFTRQEILSKVWGYEYNAKNRTIDVHIRKLREKLGDDYISTIKGIGYRLITK